MASAASQGMVAIATLLAARACDPALFGVLGVFTTLVVIGGTVASLRLEAAVVLPARDADARRLATVGLIASPVVAALTALTMLVVGPMLLPRFDAAGLLAHPWAIPTAVLVLGWRSLMLGWCTRHGHVRAIAHGRLANGGAMSIGLLAAAMISPTLGVLLGAGGTGELVDDEVGRLLPVEVDVETAARAIIEVAEDGATWRDAAIERWRTRAGDAAAADMLMRLVEPLLGPV